MFEKMLIPLDRSKLAERVFPAVTELARAFGSEVVFLGVCEQDSRDDERSCELYMAGEASQLKAGLIGTPAVLTTRVVSGKAAEQILSHAEAEHVDLIIMSSHGRSGITRWSLGGTADRVLKRVGVPLIVVRTNESAERTRIFDRILVPLDGSERSTAVLPMVVGLAAKVPCEVFLVEVIEPGIHVRTIGGMDYIPFKERDLVSTRETARKYLETMSAEFDSTKAKVSSEVLEGDAARTILDVAEQRDCTLIAMSSHGHSGIEIWSMGSVASKIAEASRQSVWLVPSFSRH